MKTIGILGGMGPAATCYVYETLIGLTAARSDQDHVPTIILSATTTPDRLMGIRGDTRHDVMQSLCRSARILETAGADMVVVACNTAHHWIADVGAAVSIPVIDMIAETADAVSARRPFAKVGLMATAALLGTGLYQDCFTRHGLDVLCPETDMQQRVDRAILDIKAGAEREDVLPVINAAAAALRGDGANLVVAGCTELSMIVGRYSELFIDPVRVVLSRMIQMAGGTLKAEISAASSERRPSQVAAV